MVDKTRLFAALRVEPDPASPGNFRCTDPIARGQGCIPVNPYRASGFSAAEAAYLTVDAGIRWDILRPFTDAHDDVVFFDPKIANPHAISTVTGRNRTPTALIAPSAKFKLLVPV